MLNPAYDSIVSGVTSVRADKLFVKVGTCIKLVDPAGIVYAEASGNYLGVVMAGGETLHTKETMSHLESRLPSSGFIRVHRSYIVNVKYLGEIKARPNGYELILTNGRQIVSGSTYRKEIRAHFLMGLGRRREVSVDYPGSDVTKLHSTTDAHRKIHHLFTDIHIRLCAPGDEEALSFIGKATFMETYEGAFADEDILAHCGTHDAPDTYRGLLENPEARTWIAETEACHAPVGYLVVTPPSLPCALLRNGDLEILRLYLLKQFQGNGSGKNLLAKAIQYAQRSGCMRLLLGDYRYNGRANGFYRRSGFGTVGEYLCRVGEHDYHDLVFGIAI